MTFPHHFSEAIMVYIWNKFGNYMIYVMTLAGSPLGSMISTATGIWLGLQY